MNKILLTTLFFSLLSAPSLAKDKREGKRESAQKMKAELNLTDEQLEKIKEIRKSSKGIHKEMKEQIKAARKDLQESLGNPKVSASELQAKFHKLESLKTEISRKRFETMLSIRSHLNETQIAKFHELGKGHKNGRGKEMREDSDDEE
jgi:Spy/CpxP family protein refolding chaperone